MLDANGTIQDDLHLCNMIETCCLHDLHYQDPAQSMYIGATHQQIDLMLGCSKVLDAMTLSYVEGPQSNHCKLYIKLDAGNLLSFNPQDKTIQPQSCLRAEAANPELVAMYHSKVLEYYESHNIARCIRKLFVHHSKLSD
jgi:hypothetical protein